MLVDPSAAVSTHDESSGEPSVVAAARVTSQIGCRAVAFLLQDSMEPERYVNARNVDGETALHIIAETSRDLASAATYSTLKALFEAGADPNMPNNRGASALHKLCNREAPAAGWAATSGASAGTRMSARDLVELFLKYGARLDLPAGPGGPMPLLCAVVRRSLTLAASLITLGASQTLVDSRGMSASIVAGNLRPNGKTIQRILLGHITDAPAMVPDEQVEKCMVSQEAFSMFNRRHHCRHCGCVVSNNFSKRTMPIPKFGLKKAMRVCDPCCDALELAAKSPAVWQQQLHKLEPPASAASIAAFAAAQQARRREARMKVSVFFYVPLHFTRILLTV